MSPTQELETGVIYCDDNLARLARLRAESVDLIYLDPPFFSNQNYEVIWGDEAEVRSFEDRWRGGIHVYIEWMRHRMIELHRVLAPTGSLYLHCDPTASHYLKVMLDDVFGPSMFRSEVIWKRSSAHNSARRYGPVHDTILFYSKTDDYVWKPVYQPLPDETIDAWYNNVEAETNRRYNRADLTAAGKRTGESGAVWRGIDVTAKGRHWAIPRFVKDIVGDKSTLDALDALDAAGRIHWPARRDGMPMLKRYVDESKGVPAQDVITHISPLKNNSKPERLGYPTQKPEALLELIIEASSRPGDVVLDPFCGCGTTIAVAHRLRRQWIGIDISLTAAKLMLWRMSKLGAEAVVEGLPKTEADLKRLKPFEFQNWVISRFNGKHAPRKSGDFGVDGYSFLEHLPIQVKQSEKVGRVTVDNFETAIKRERKTKGYIVAFSFTKNAYEEVARAKRHEGIEIVLVDVATLLEDQATVPAAAAEQLFHDLLPLTVPDREALPTAEELIASDRR